jgi:DNA (cytosine-5)-methyltransferase 1
MKPKALDLFCGAGGATKGLQRAGFYVVGVDIKPQPRYCGDEFIQADAMEGWPGLQDDFDFIWASPPCQAHTVLRKMWNSKQHVDLVTPTRERLAILKVPWAIENVPGAPLGFSAKLCGTMFDLRTPCGAELRRHRYFETSFLVTVPKCHHGKSCVGVYGGHVRDRCRTVGIYGEGVRDLSHDRRRTITVTGSTPQQNVVRNRVRQTYTPDDAAKAMGIDWMTLAELCQAIPPAYSEYIGKFAMQHLEVASAK